MTKGGGGGGGKKGWREGGGGGLRERREITCNANDSDAILEHWPYCLRRLVLFQLEGDVGEEEYYFI